MNTNSSLNLNLNESILRYGISELHWHEKFLHLSLILATILNVTVTWKKSIMYLLIYEPVHEISNNAVCATSKASDLSAHTCSLIRAFASRLSIL